MGRTLIQELEGRGLVAQVSDKPRLSKHLETGSRTLYCGFDPTADSLHIGNLVPLLTLRRFQSFGHRPILLLGGATGLIGDPSGRADERGLNENDVVAGWVERIRSQVEGLIDFEGNNAAVMTNNLDWTQALSVIDFLRDVGKHFSVNAMIQRDSVRTRIERDGEGISFTEFSYVLLQAMDYAELAKRYDCTVQIGGSDQWGNIVSGMDLVRRKSVGQASAEVFAMTVPLITKADGTKFGKTASGAVWLDEARTSPYSFYQFWLNTADSDVIHFLKVFTFVSLEDISDLAASLAQSPEQRVSQRRLAEEVTRLVHGAGAVESARRITDCLFQGELTALTESDLDQLRQDGMGCTVLPDSAIGLLTAMVDADLAPSRGAARKLVRNNGVRVNGIVQIDQDRELDWQDALYGNYYLLRRGKKNWHLLVRDKDRAELPESA
ncbi:MAG: tyrosine--tRNA ligase [Gammaproteobacteria bacterium]|nr:MAG: tyrosine--tRNA ligase [Gammaproteobacteria bacterium]